MLMGNLFLTKQKVFSRQGGLQETLWQSLIESAQYLDCSGEQRELKRW